MQFKLVMMIDGEFVTVTSHSRAAFRVALKGLGFWPAGLETRTVLRAELQGEGRFDGLAGPMWDGAGEDGRGAIRYEDHDAHAHLSA